MEKNCDRGWDVCVSQYSRVIGKKGHALLLNQALHSELS